MTSSRFRIRSQMQKKIVGRLPPNFIRNLPMFMVIRLRLTKISEINFKDLLITLIMKYLERNGKIKLMNIMLLQFKPRQMLLNNVLFLGRINLTNFNNNHPISRE
jgi:hypothetical protein